MKSESPAAANPQAWAPKARLALINLTVLALLLSPLLGPWLLAHWALRHPRWAWGPLLELARWPYLNIYRQGIQGRKDCFQVDQTLTYIGQPKGYASAPRSCCSMASMTGGKTAPLVNSAFNPAVTAAMWLTRPM